MKHPPLRWRNPVGAAALCGALVAAAALAATLTAFSGPWSISFAINLTPDVETGIGKWKTDEFVKALKTGKHLGVAAEHGTMNCPDDTKVLSGLRC